MTEILMLGSDDRSLLGDVAEGVFDAPLRDDLLREFLEDPRHHIVVARREGRVVGVASAVHYVHPDKEPELWINEVAVAPGNRGTGIGTRMIRRLLTLAGELGCREAWVLTERGNDAASALYESVGGVRPETDPIMFVFSVPAGGVEAP